METKTAAAPKIISDSLKNGMIGLQEAEKPRLQTKEAGQEELDDEEQRSFKEEEVGMMMMMQRDHDGKRETIKEEEEEEEIEDSFNNDNNNKNERKEESGPHRLAAATSTNGASSSSSSASQPQKQNLFESSRSRMYTVAGKIKQQSANNLHEKTFRAWLNSVLRVKSVHLDGSLKDHLNNGLTLIHAIEVLSGEACPIKYNPSPERPIHKMENITIAMNWLKTFIPILNVRPQDIMEGNMKVILGILWMMILHWKFVSLQTQGREGIDIKSNLLNWCRQQTAGLPNLQLNDFTNSWYDGMGFCALIFAYDPKLIDYHSLSPDDAEHNLGVAFKIAEEHLGIAPLLEVQDMLDSDLKPDEICMMAYLSEFRIVFNQKTSQMLQKGSAWKKAQHPRKLKEVAETDSERQKRLEEEEEQRRKEEEEKKRLQEHQRIRRETEVLQARIRILEEAKRQEEEEMKKRREERERKKKMELEKRRLAVEQAKAEVEESKRASYLAMQLEAQRKEEEATNKQEEEEDLKQRAEQEELAQNRDLEIEKLRFQTTELQKQLSDFNEMVQGKLIVRIHKAQRLRARREFVYCTAHIEHQTGTTPHVSSKQPVWNAADAQFEFFVSGWNAVLRVYIYDEHRVRNDKAIGKIKVNVSTLPEGLKTSNWYKLVPKRAKFITRDLGEIKISLLYKIY